MRESGRRNCEFSRYRLALAFPALILSDAPIGQQPAFGNDSGMTRDARSPDTAIRLGEIGISPGPHRPEFPTKPISPITLQHRYCPTRSDQVRRSRRQNRPIPKPQAEKYGSFRFQRKTRRRLYPTDKTRPPSARLLPSDRSRDRPPCGRTEQPAAAPRTVRPYRCRPNKATKRRAKITDSFRASAPNDARKRLPFVTRQARISAKQ